MIVELTIKAPQTPNTSYYRFLDNGYSSIIGEFVSPKCLISEFVSPKCLRMADCEDRETPVNGSFDKSLKFCPKILLGDLILKIIFKDSIEFLILEIRENLKTQAKTPDEPEVSQGSLSQIIFSLASLSQLPVGARIRLTVVKWKNS